MGEMLPQVRYHGIGRLETVYGKGHLGNLGLGGALRW
jgi:hypothetical protein